MKTALEQNREDALLGAAWRRCVAALPAEDDALSLHRWNVNDYWAEASVGDETTVYKTPTAALEALAEALEARKAQECPGGVGHVGHDPNSGPGSDWCPACGGYARVAP
jgi:hypothetical protein